MVPVPRGTHVGVNHRSQLTRRRPSRTEGASERRREDTEERGITQTKPNKGVEERGKSDEETE